MVCSRCGHTMECTTGGNYHCNLCGFEINDLVYRGYKDTVTFPNQPIIDGGTITPPQNNQAFGMHGWICPICGKGVSPFTDVCPCTNFNNTITYNNNNRTLLDELPKEDLCDSQS